MKRWIIIAFGGVFLLIVLFFFIPHFLRVQPSEFELAVISNDVNKVKTILNKEKRINLNFGLIRACTGGHTEVAEFLLKKGAEVDSSTDNGCTPLWWAARNGNYDLVKLLIENGANIDLPEKSNVTPLHMAVEFSRVEVVDLLIKNNVKLNELDWEGKTPLDYAKDNIVIEILKDNGAKYSYELN